MMDDPCDECVNANTNSGYIEGEHVNDCIDQVLSILEGEV